MEVACSAGDDCREDCEDDRDVCEASISNPGLKLNASGDGGKDDNVGQPEIHTDTISSTSNLGDNEKQA